MPLSAAYQPAPRLPALGDGFFARVEAARFPLERLRFRNQRAAAALGLDGLDDDEWRDTFARFRPLPQNLEAPLALAYHGHQFGQYNPFLGDGRGFVFAQLRDGGGRLLDLTTKGSGRTPFSRDGDGRLTLQGGVREVLAALMLEAQGVRTAAPLSLFETGESLERHDEPSPTRAGVLVRVQHGSLRIGTFQRLAHTGDRARLAALVDYAVETLHPDLADASDRPVALLRRVTALLAETCGRWLAAGFVHGVLNTDNLSVTGESFDYGPFRFLPRWDEAFVAAYFDHGGRYAFGRQPAAVRWGLERFAEALALVAEPARLSAALVELEPRILAARDEGLLVRLGVAPRGRAADALLASRVLCFLEESALLPDRFFFDWYGGEAAAPRAQASPVAALYTTPRFAAVRRTLADYAPRPGARLDHPCLARPRPPSLVNDRIESAWARVAADDDWSAVDALLDEIAALRDLHHASLPRASEDPSC